jgi:hypothetical protein
VHALVAPVLLRMAGFDAFDLNAETHQTKSLERLNKALGWRRGRHCQSGWRGAGRVNSCSKAVNASYSRVVSSASHRSTKHKAWSVTVSG